MMSDVQNRCAENVKPAEPNTNGCAKKRKTDNDKSIDTYPALLSKGDVIPVAPRETRGTVADASEVPVKAALTDVADSQTTEDVGADSDVTKHSASADSEATSPADKRKAKRSVAGKGKTKSEADKRKTKVSGAAKQKTQSKPKPSVEKSVSKRSVAEKRAEPSATESDKPSDALVLFEKKVKPRRASNTKWCSIPGCTNMAFRSVRQDDIHGAAGRRCVRHGGGAGFCNATGCKNVAKSRLTSEDQYGEPGLRCKRHNPRFMCSAEGCTRLGRDAPGMAGMARQCSQHGGGIRCTEPGCNAVAVSTRQPGSTVVKCTLHGGGLRCHEEGCNNFSQMTLNGTSVCRKHGLQMKNAGAPAKAPKAARLEGEKVMKSRKRSAPSAKSAGEDPASKESQVVNEIGVNGAKKPRVAKELAMKVPVSKNVKKPAQAKKKGGTPRDAPAASMDVVTGPDQAETTVIDAEDSQAKTSSVAAHLVETAIDVEAETSAVSEGEAPTSTSDVSKVDSQAETSVIDAKADSQAETHVIDAKAESEAKTSSVAPADSQKETSVIDAKAKSEAKTSSVAPAESEAKTSSVEPADSQAEKNVIDAKAESKMETTDPKEVQTKE